MRLDARITPFVPPSRESQEAILKESQVFQAFPFL